MCEKRRDYIYIYIYIYIHLSSSGLCSLPTALLPLHQRLHIQRPLCQAPEVCRRHHADRPHPGRWRICLQWGLVQLRYQIWPQKTTEGSPDCWANPWYNPPQSPRTYSSRVSKRAGKITLETSHPAHSLFELLPPGRRYRALSTRTTRHRNGFFTQAIHLMNTWH